MQREELQEDQTNTFSGIAVENCKVIGLHILRRFEEGALVGAHIAGLWVDERHRGVGVARTLKEHGEAWARAIGADFINTNVQVANARMLEINERCGFEPYRINLRNKGLQPTRLALQDGHVGGTQRGICVQVARSPRDAAILLGHVRSGPCT